MTPFSVLRDSLYFFRRHLWAILQLCLPLVVLESISKQVVDHVVGVDGSPVYDIVTGLLFYPLYTAALILFLDARSDGYSPRTRDLLAMAVRLWPMFALLAAMSTILIMLGVSMFVLPGLWVMVKLVFSEYLLVLRGYTPMAAMTESFRMSQGHFWRILTCVLGALVPLWAIDLLSGVIWPEPGNLLSLLLDSLNGFLQLFTSVVLYRLYMLFMDKAPTSQVQ
ncbi:MAG: hypothetical protein PW845_15775 [Pseudomonas sp.]|nr:hypothetical protein [Pseudomonas sp.]